MKLKDLTGNTYGRLTVLEELPNRRSPITGKSYVFWKCKCDCGNVHAVNGTSLKAGTVKSCGCLHKEVWTHIHQARNKFPVPTICGKCIWCGNDIHAKPGKKLKFCSLECYYNSLKTERKIKCLACGISIEKRPSVAKKFCSYACYSKYKNDGYGPFRNILSALMQRTKDKERSTKQVSVSLQYLKDLWDKQKGICPYTGWSLILKPNKGKAVPSQASIDRINNLQGYVPGNIQFISVIANYAKNSFSEEDLFKFCNAVSGNRARNKNGTIST